MRTNRAHSPAQAVQPPDKTVRQLRRRELPIAGRRALRLPADYLYSLLCRYFLNAVLPAKGTVCRYFQAAYLSPR